MRLTYDANDATASEWVLDSVADCLCGIWFSARALGDAHVTLRHGELLRMFDRDAQIEIVPISTEGSRMSPMTSSLIASSALHLLVILLLLFGTGWLMQRAPKGIQIVPINMVQLGVKTASPPSSELATLPQDKARENPSASSPEAVPNAQAASSQGEQHQVEQKTTSNPLSVTKTRQKPEIHNTPEDTRRNDLPLGKDEKEPAPANDLSARLKSLARLRQPTPPVPPSPIAQDGTGWSNLTATSANAARGRDATYAVKDFIRAQVERRWNLHVDTLNGADWVVSIHMVLSPDGSVRQAEIVDNPRFHSDNAYRDFAFSARNAVLLSSPLTVPPGEYNIAKDIILDFHSKQVLQ